MNKKIAIIGLCCLINSTLAASEEAQQGGYQAPAELVIAIYNNCLDKQEQSNDYQQESAVLSCVNEDLAILGFNKINAHKSLIALIEKE